MKITDITVLSDTNIESKYREKVDHYKDLDIELSRLWQKQVIIIPIIVGSKVEKTMEKLISTSI